MPWSEYSRLLFEPRSGSQVHVAELKHKRREQEIEKVPAPGRSLPQTPVGSTPLQPGCVAPVCMDLHLVWIWFPGIWGHYHFTLILHSLEPKTTVCQAQLSQCWAQTACLSTSFFFRADIFHYKPVCATIASVPEKLTLMAGELFRLPCPALSLGVCSNSCLTDDEINISSPATRLLFLPSIFPSIRVFPNDLSLCIRWPNYWSFSFSIGPSQEYSGLISFRLDWFDLAVWGTLTSLLQHQNLKT